MTVLFTELLNLNKTTFICSRTYILLMNGHSNGKCASMSANVLSLDVTECYHAPSLFTYVLNDQSISCIDQHSYLGVTLTSNMSFSPHIQKISAKATRMLNFIRRNLYNCSKEIKSRAYLTLIRPILEYASPVWDPHLIKYCKLRN